MQRTWFALLAVFVLALGGNAEAQESVRPQRGATWAESIGCALPADTARLRLTLPLEVLDHLERMSNSVFVQAFLVRHMADPAAGGHRLSRCAREFTDAPVADLGKLRQNLPDAAAMIDALRTAELARQRTVQLADSARTLKTAVTRLRADTSLANLNASGDDLLRAADRFCAGSTRGACAPLHRAVAEIDSFRRARSALEAASERARQVAEEARRASDDALGAASALEADTLLLKQLQAAETEVDSVAVAELKERITRWSVVIDSLSVARDSILRVAGAANDERQSAAAAAEAVRARLAGALQSLENEIDSAGGWAVRTIDALEGSRIGTSVATLAAPPAQIAAANPAARSANLMLELADFIIDRAQREAVNSFVVNLHALVQHEPLLRHGFPDTWGSMHGLSTRPDGRLNAVDVGRIPLTAWRATLAGDFVMLPVNLLAAGPVAICRSDDAAARTASRERSLAAPAAREACRQRVAVLRPLAPVARRLLEGDGVFHILRDASSFAPPQGPDLPPEWRRLSQGLTVLAALAETYLVQGHAPSADPARHPYLLTTQSLVQVPQRQRDAFVRLLLVRAAPSAADAPTSIDEGALHDAAAGITRLLERIASRPATPEPRPADAALVVRGGFDALISAADMARVLAQEETAARLDTVKTRWRAVAGALEPIVARDFGLALSRTTVLLRELRGVELPGPLVTFVALASSLSEAQNGEQVRRAFEAAASPVGGWQSKRYGEGGGSITAFPGLSFGLEQVIRERSDPSGISDPAATVGASLPVGVEWQWQRRGAVGTSAPDCTGPVCGLGVFVPLIDLGALLTYRLGGSGEVDSEPNASVRQVFAPGAYLSLALTRTVPVNLLMGGQLMPSLRRVSGAEGVVNRSAMRFGIGIVMDVLLLGF